MSWCPSLWAKVWVDDLKITAFGRKRCLGKLFPQVVKRLIVELKKAELEASRRTPGKPGGKTKTVASFNELEEGLREPLGQLGIQVVQATVYLGLDLKQHGRGGKARQQRRLVRMKWRVKRLRQVRSQGKRMA